MICAFDMLRGDAWGAPARLRIPAGIERSVEHFNHEVENASNPDCG
jgi:hypothetical protein